MFNKKALNLDLQNWLGFMSFYTHLDKYIIHISLYIFLG